MQSLRHAPHRLGPPDRPGRTTSIAVFSPWGDAFLAIVSRPPPTRPRHRTESRAELLPVRRGMNSLQWQVNSCPNGSYNQLSCSNFHWSQLTHPWRCPPQGAPALLTEHQPHQPPVTAVSSQSPQKSDPSHVSLPTFHALSTLQGDAAASPPAGFADVVQRLHHNFGKGHCTTTDSSPSQPNAPVKSPHTPIECRRAFFQSPRPQTTVSAGEDRFLPYPGNDT